MSDSSPFGQAFDFLSTHDESSPPSPSGLPESGALSTALRQLSQRMSGFSSSTNVEPAPSAEFLETPSAARMVSQVLDGEFLSVAVAGGI